MIISNTERKLRLLRLDLQYFGEGGEGEGGTGAEAPPAAGTPATETKTETETVLSSEAIQRMVQQAVDKQTANLGKKISDLTKENETLKRANMTAEQIAQADKEEFEKQKAEVEKQKREIHAHKAVAAAGFGTDADAVVAVVIGDTDEATDERLKNFKSLVDKLVAAKVQETFKANGRTPNGAQANTDTKTENTIAENLGKARAAQAKQANDILNHYIGGKK